MKINYNNVNDETKLAAADLMLKVEAIDSGLADIQTEKATAEIGYEQKRQTLNGERNRLIEEIRKLQKATLV